MGCDYYIVKQLEVRHINDDDDEIITTIELDRERGYFFDEVDSRDSDDSSGSEDSDMRYERKYGKYLNVTYVPRILFENGKWKNERVQKRYEDSIRDEIGNDMLLSIIKKEVRYLR